MNQQSQPSVNPFADLAAAHRALAEKYEVLAPLFAAAALPGPRQLPPVSELDESDDAQPSWIAPAADPDITRIATPDQLTRIDTKWPRVSIEEWERSADPLKPKVIANIQRELAATSAANNGNGSSNGNGSRRSDPPKPPPTTPPKAYRLPGDPP